MLRGQSSIARQHAGFLRLRPARVIIGCIDSSRVYEDSSRGVSRSRKFHSIGSHSKTTLSATSPSSSSGTTTTNRKEDVAPRENIAADWRPMTFGERIKHFPGAVKQLYKSCMLYHNIHDASRTRLNAWTIDHPMKQSSMPSRVFHLYEDEARPGRIPRRQHEQQRRLRADIVQVAPLVLIWLLPIIGYLPMFLAVGAPRQVLSRHFLNEYEVHHYAELEYRQRKIVYPHLGEMFWSMATVSHHDSDSIFVTEEGGDAAGPVIDAMPLYSVFANRTGTSHELKLRRGVLATVSLMPREYLVQFALAAGVGQNLPSWISTRMIDWMPRGWLRFQVRNLARVVADDDTLLLLENYDANNCESLSDVEVMDACLIRGLPIDIPADDMRICLTNHLKVIASVKDRSPHGPITDEGFGLFTLHLAILRSCFKNRRG